MNPELREFVTLFAKATGYDEAQVEVEMAEMLRTCDFSRLDVFGISSAKVREQTPYPHLLISQHKTIKEASEAYVVAFESAVTNVATEKITLYRAVVEHMDKGGGET